MKNNQVKLGIIGTVGIPAKYGGFETLAQQLVLNLAKDLDITVYNSKKEYPAEDRINEWNGAKIKYMPFSANGVQSVIYDIICMIHALIFCDVLLILGVSGCLFLPIVKLFPYKKVIVNIDGLEWRRSKWSPLAKRFLKLSERFAVTFADQIVGDNQAIKDYVKTEYGIQAQLIEYGGDHASPQAMSEELLTSFPFLSEDYAFKVCRIEPENNVHLILEAFAKHEEFPLVIIGNWNKSTYGKDLRAKYQNYKNIFILDPIYDSCRLNAIRSNATIYVHGHSAGGTNPSLVEAMYLGLPIIAFDVVYNRVTTEDQAIFFKYEDQLIDVLNLIHYVPLGQIAFEMEKIANKRYRWEIIANKYFNAVLGKVYVPQPAFA